MRKGGSKAKGASTEREVAKLLSLWWTADEKDDVFYITAGSGARQTTRRKQNKETANSAGDLNYLDVEGKVLIDGVLFEIKRGYNELLDVLAIVDAKTTRKPNIILQWVEKAEREREENERLFISLIIRRDYKEYFIIIPVGLVEALHVYNPLPEIERTICIQGEYLLLPLEVFFRWVNPENLKALLESRARQ